MAEPVVTVRVDWGNDGAFDGAYDDVSASLADGLSWTRGRSADFSAEATGQAQFTLSNHDDRFTPDRNWHDNPSFEVGTAGWSVGEIGGLFGAATSITQVTDNAGQGGTKAGEAVFPAAATVAWQADSFQSDAFGTLTTAGVSYPIPYPFRSGVVYSVRVWLKSVSGALTVRAGLASAGTPTDIASSAANVTAAWAAYAFTWTPSADRTDAVFFVRTTAAAAATVRIDAVQVNPGSSANTYIEAPTRGQLVPGRPVHVYATHSATDYALFFGYIQRLAPNPRDPRSVTVTCYDVLQRLAETDVMSAATVSTGREFRREVLGDFERGDRNLVANPEFATDTAGWAVIAGTPTATRITTDGPPGATGTTCAEVATSNTFDLFGVTPTGVPTLFAGQAYRATFWLRATGFVVKASIWANSVTAVSRVITPSAKWTQHSMTWVQGATVPVTDVAVPRLVFGPSAGCGTFRVGCVSITRGQALLPYAAVGTGRQPNWCSNGGFDGGDASGWEEGYTNLVSNGDFEVDVAGWTQTADAFHAAGAGAPARITTHPYFGTASMELSTTAVASSGAHTVISGTFKAGQTVRVHARVGYYTVGGGVYVGIGSQGTPTDFAEQLWSVAAGAYTTSEYWFTWTPTSDYSDVHLYVRQVSAVAGTLSVDGVAVIRRPRSAISDPPYAITGPGGGGAPLVAPMRFSTTAKYGSQSLQADTPAVATAGLCYDFADLGGTFVSGKPYTLSLWLRPSSDMPYKVGLSASKATTFGAGDGTFDEATTTGTATANVWTQVTVTWTPTTDRPAATAYPWYIVAFVWQTDATARTFLIDSVRVIPGNAADEWDLANWSLADEPDQCTPAMGGSALSALSRLNGYLLTRHWIEPTMATPWWSYVTASRDEVRTSVEAFTDVNDLKVAELDRSAIINIVPVQHSGGPTYYSDAPSVAKYGPSPSSSIGNATEVTVTVADAVGPTLLARYRDPRSRLTMTINDRWPSQLERELNDSITLTLAPQMIFAQRCNILSLATTVRAGGAWETVYVLEEE